MFHLLLPGQNYPFTYIYPIALNHKIEMNLLTNFFQQLKKFDLLWAYWWKKTYSTQFTWRGTSFTHIYPHLHFPWIAIVIAFGITVNDDARYKNRAYFPLTHPLICILTNTFCDRLVFLQPHFFHLTSNVSPPTGSWHHDQRPTLSCILYSIQLWQEI